MSKEDEQITALTQRLDELSAMRRQTYEEQQRLQRELRTLHRRRNARVCRKRKWLYVTANIFWAGPKYGEKVKVYRHGNKYVYVEYRGRYWRFVYSQVGPDAPGGDVALNRHLAKTLSAAGM